MKNYLYVFVGGVIGGLLRVMTTRAETPFTLGDMNLTILLINIAGAFLLGMFLSGSEKYVGICPGLHLGIATGFFGSFTTFSTLSMEAAGLLQTGNVMGLALYVIVSCAAGLVAADLGFRAGVGSGFIRIGSIRPRVLGENMQVEVIPIEMDESEEE